MVSKAVSLNTVISGRLFPSKADVSSFLPNTRIAMAVAARSTYHLSTAERRDSAHTLHRPVCFADIVHRGKPFPTVADKIVSFYPLCPFLVFVYSLWFYKELSNHSLSDAR